MPLNPAPISSQSSQRGQMFVGYIIAIFIIMALAVTVTNTMRRNRLSSQDQIYRELALNVAKAGFDDGLSYFRRQNDGVYLSAYSAYAPTTQAWVTPWPQWPDAAFMPQSADTDSFSSLSISTVLHSSGKTSSAIVRTITMNTYSNTATSVEMKSSRLWGRYVLRRQNVRNWSPGSNTHAAFSDPDAAHDITHIRGQGLPGSGNVWSIVSRGYLYAYGAPLTNPAGFEGNSLLNAPLRTYNGQRLLLAQARVYGELSRINFNQPTAATFMTRGNLVNVNTNGIINGGSATAIARPSTDVTTYTGSGSVSGSSTYSNTQAAPSLGFIFPGQTSVTLKSIASRLDATKVGGVEVLPSFDPTSSAFNAQVSKNSFYYVTSTVSLTGTGTGSKVLSGVGLMIIEGNLTIGAKNNSSWAGVVIVLGNVDLRGPAEISGTLICTGSLSVGNSADINKATVEYNIDAIDTVQSYLQNFQVLNSSVVSTSF